MCGVPEKGIFSSAENLVLADAAPLPTTLVALADFPPRFVQTVNMVGGGQNTHNMHSYGMKVSHAGLLCSCKNVATRYH